MSKKIKIEALKVLQGSMEFYTCVINSKELREIAYVSKRNPENPLGYQRFLSMRRLKEVGEYIKKPRATFPNSIIINFDAHEVRFEEIHGSNKGVLVIPRQEKVAWIIDGQHRLYGFEKSEGKEFDLAVTAFIGLSIPDQAVIFKVINSTQKGVNPSLIYDLISLTKDAEYMDERAHELIKSLDEDTDSPWKGLIKMLGTGQGLISQAAFSGQIKHILQDTIFKEYPSGEQAKILKDYFSAIKNLFPDAWGNKKYVLCKTLGVAAFLKVMTKVLIHCQLRNDFSKNTIQDILKSIKNRVVPTATGAEPLNFSSKQLGVIGGEKGQQHLADLIDKGLPPIRPIS